MQAGSYVVCINDSNWNKLAYVKLSELPVKGKSTELEESFQILTQIVMKTA